MIKDIEVAKKLVNIEASANSRNIHFNLSFRRMKQLLNTKKCFYSGEILNFNHGDENQLTIERINNDIGYIDSNVVACSKKYNSLKSNHSDIMFINIVNGINRFKNKNKKQKNNGNK